MSDDRGSRGPVRRPAGTLRVGSIAGSPVLISRSWFLIAGLIAVMVAPAVERAEPGGRRSGELLLELPVARYGAPRPPGAAAYAVGEARYLHFWYDTLPAADAALADSIIRTLRRAEP